MLDISSDTYLECPACGHATRQRHLYVKNGCAILRCQACGLGRTQVAAFDPHSYYTGDYFSGGHADGYADYRGSEKVLRREFKHSVDFVRKYVAAGRLLDVGCAYGFFLQEAKAYFDVAGIELAPEAANHARGNGLNVVNGIADSETLAKLGRFDVITLLDVIEHLPDPLTTLRLCQEHLNPGGVIMVTTGDFGSIAARLTGPHWRLMTPPQHLWFFTIPSLSGMARQLGLQVTHADHPWKIVPLSLMLFQLQRMAGRRGNPPSGGTIGMPVNLFDAMRVVLRKPAQ